jgi:carboxylesterase
MNPGLTTDEQQRLVTRLFEDDKFEPFDFIAGPQAETGALLIHGFTGSPAELRPLGQALHSHGIDAHGMLVPGMARDMVRLNSMTQEIWESAARAAWEPIRAHYRHAILLGYSMGGALALELAAWRSPDQLILLAPFTHIADRLAWLLPVLRFVRREYRPFDGLDPADSDVRKFFEDTLPGIDMDDPDLLRDVVQQSVIRMDVIHELRKLGRRAEKLAKRVTAPTLVVQGRQDRIVRPRDTDHLVARLNGPVDYRKIEGDHMLPFDAWAAESAVVRDLVLQAVAELAPAHP